LLDTKFVERCFYRSESLLTLSPAPDQTPITLEGNLE